jgi:hypothetical protein
LDKRRWISVRAVEEGRTGQVAVEELFVGKAEAEAAEAAEAAAAVAAGGAGAAAVWAGADDRPGGMEADCREFAVLGSVALVAVDGRLQVTEVGRRELAEPAVADESSADSARTAGQVAEDLHMSEAAEHMTVAAGSVGGQHTNPPVRC